MVRDLLGDGEAVQFEVSEHRLGGARLLEPAHVFATNFSIIIVRIGLFGLSKDYKMIKYESIKEVKLDRGPLFCRVHFSLQGELEDNPSAQKWLVGMRYNDALELIRVVEDKQRPAQGTPSDQDA
jgi:hypothetical protein